MKIRYSHTVTKPAIDLVNFQSKVNALGFTPDGIYLAVATNDRYISIFDARSNERLDRFSTKPNNKGPKDYLITSIHFQPQGDSQPKLAVGQSDCILFVYKWTQDDPEDIVWNGKKSIVNKFLESAAIVSIVWPASSSSQCVYALMNGKIKVGNLRSNKSHILYTVESSTLCLALNSNGSELISGHGDGSIYKFTFPTISQESTCVKLLQTSQPPVFLIWNSSICVGGNGADVAFYDVNGNKEQIISFENESSFLNIARGSPNGRFIAIASNKMLHVLTRESQSGDWIKCSNKALSNGISTTAVAWKPNGSSIAIGTASGLLNVYSTIYSRYSYNNMFEITHLSPAEVMIHDKETPNTTPISIQSHMGEITKVDMFPEPGCTELRFIVGRVSDGLILCDMKSSPLKISQIPWTWCMEESFSFLDAGVCLISRPGELSVIQYGKNELVGSFRTDFTSFSVVSLRSYGNEKNGKVHDWSRNIQIAFLLDAKTINIQSLTEQRAPLQIFHDRSIEFLEMNETCSYCLFLDDNKDLYLFDTSMKVKSHLVGCCRYGQWVPLSNAIVALSQNFMYVWYHANYLDNPIKNTIEGDISDVVREDRQVQVIVRNGSIQKSYTLQDECLQFYVSLDANDLNTCMNLLAKFEHSSLLESMTNQLLDRSLECFDLNTAYMCATHLGKIDVTNELKSLIDGEANESTSRARLCELIF